VSTVYESTDASSHAAVQLLRHQQDVCRLARALLRRAVELSADTPECCSVLAHQLTVAARRSTFHVERGAGNHDAARKFERFSEAQHRSADVTIAICMLMTIDAVPEQAADDLLELAAWLSETLGKLKGRLSWAMG